MLNKIKKLKETSFLFLSIALFTLLLFTACKSINAVERVSVNFNYVTAKAKNLSNNSYAKPLTVKNNLTQSEYAQIDFNQTKTLWKVERLPFGLEMFHLGYIYNTPIPINEFKNDYSQELRFSNELFNFGSLTKGTLTNAQNLTGYAGFKMTHPINEPHIYGEIISFLGNEKFRALGRNNIYGAYATTVSFLEQNQKLNNSYFTEFWLGKPNKNAKSIIFYALTDNPQAATAYEFNITPGETTVLDIKSVIFPRQNINTLAIAPLKTFFLYGENTLNHFESYYPEVHNSDGLIISADEEIIWHPFQNPKILIKSSHEINRLKYFGLLQRDRNYNNYLNPSIPFQKMPNVWIQPKSDWGKGSVELLEAPTDSYNANNISAYWKPAQPLVKGRPYSFDYTMNWSMQNPKTDKAPVIDTYIGKKNDIYTFLVLYSSKSLKKLSPVTVLTPKIKVSNNAVLADKPTVRKDPYNHYWRVLFSIKPKTSDSRSPIKASCSLNNNKKIITETWNNKWIP
ncbi:MAG TPA: glucan biosynthesis protein [Victivallales bacterium]|nr:glucan biosynthesis protein [Victivallales bacterium]